MRMEMIMMMSINVYEDGDGGAVAVERVDVGN